MNCLSYAVNYNRWLYLSSLHLIAWEIEALDDVAGVDELREEPEMGADTDEPGIDTGTASWCEYPAPPFHLIYIIIYEVLMLPFNIRLAATLLLVLQQLNLSLTGRLFLPYLWRQLQGCGSSRNCSENAGGCGHGRASAVQLSRRQAWKGAADILGQGKTFRYVSLE